MPDLALGSLQEWMAIVVRHKLDARAAVRGKAARRIVPLGAVRRGDVVRPSERLDPVGHLQVYNGGYFARLKEVLETDYEVLATTMGPGAFHELALDYVDRHPSRHPNLNHFGKHLPEFIAGRKSLPNRAFLRDLARLERAMSDAFDAPEFEAADLSALGRLSEAQWQDAVFHLNPSVRILSFSYPVNPHLQAVLDRRNPEAPSRGASRVVVYRKADRVWRLSLPAPMHRILRALGDGEAFGAALERGGRHRLDVSRWFQEWSADGLFSRIDVAPGPGG